MNQLTERLRQGKAIMNNPKLLHALIGILIAVIIIQAVWQGLNDDEPGRYYLRPGTLILLDTKTGDVFQLKRRNPTNVLEGGTWTKLIGFEEHITEIGTGSFSARTIRTPTNPMVVT